MGQIMKLKLSLFLFVLALLTGCNNDKEAKDAGADLLYTYSTANTYNWDPSDITEQSTLTAGECKIENGSVIYTKTDLDFSGYDSCRRQIPDTSGSCTRGYFIDFSNPTPTLQAGDLECS